MATTAETILAALQARLEGASLGATVERSRAIAFEICDTPGVVIKPRSEESNPHANRLLRCILAVEIEIHTRGDLPDQLADPIAEKIDAAIRLDPGFGGLAMHAFRSAKAWDFTDSDGTGGRLSVTYQIHYLDPA